MTSQGAVRTHRNAANPDARSASIYAIVPGRVPVDITMARWWAIKPSAIVVNVNKANDIDVSPQILPVVALSLPRLTVNGLDCRAAAVRAANELISRYSRVILLAGVIILSEQTGRILSRRQTGLKGGDLCISRSCRPRCLEYWKHWSWACRSTRWTHGVFLDPWGNPDGSRVSHNTIGTLFGLSLVSIATINALDFGDGRFFLTDYTAINGQTAIDQFTWAYWTVDRLSSRSYRSQKLRRWRCSVPVP